MVPDRHWGVSGHDADTLSAVSASQSVPGWMMVAFGAKQTLFIAGARWLGRE
jgi:hypothetical protein